MYIFFGILVFGLLLVIHEGGHFLAAKACGIQVNEFSIGIGPLICQYQGRETKYSLRPIPLMAYCALEGEGEEDRSNPRAFLSAAPWKRFLVLAAGPVFNFIAGLLVVVLMYAGVSVYATPTITGFAEGCPAQGETMLMEGDTILSINGRAILVYNEIPTLLSLDTDGKVDLTVRRNGERVTLTDVPLALREYEIDGKKSLRYGLDFALEQVGVLGRLRYGFFYTVDFGRMTLWGLELLFTGQAGVKDMQGPVGLVSTMNDVGKQAPNVLDGLLNVLYLGAFISVNLCLMNLLPFPGLDGGQIVLLVLNTLGQKLFGRSLPPRAVQVFNFTGLVLLLGLAVFVAFQDVFRLIQR